MTSCNCPRHHRRTQWEIARWYLRYLAISLATFAAWRWGIITALAADKYLYCLLYSAGLIAAMAAGIGTADEWSRRRPRRRWGVW